MAEVPVRRTCSTMDVHRRLLNTDPAYVSARLAIENLAFLYRTGARAPRRTGVSKIPIVVHVVFNTAEQNISNAQIASQVAVFNRDYRGAGTGTPPVPAPFAGLVADARIEFELAKMDPAGKPSSGITRTPTAITAFLADDSVKSAAKGGTDAWPAAKYLNIWVCSLAGGVLGYAQFPGGPSATDGVVIHYSAFGTTGTATAPFNLGRTATHEVGHWLNLLHIWGDDGTGCNGDDFVADTPNQAGPNFGVPSFPRVTCSNGPNGDLFVNFMDYTDDVCMQMFTAGQVTRIDTALDGLRATVIGQEPEPTPLPTASATMDLLFYDRATGEAEVYAFDADGSPTLVRRYDSWRPNWDIVAPCDFARGSKPEVLFYNRQTGETELYAVDAQSTFSLIGRNNWRPNWDAIVGGALTETGQRHVFFYAKSAGQAELHHLDDQGNLTLLRDYSGWRTSWDAVVAGDLIEDGARNVLFYDRAAGEAELYTVDRDGYFSLSQRFGDLGTNWDVIVIGNLIGGSRRNLLFYDRRVGDAALAAFDGQVNLSILRRYSGWRTTWNAVVAGDLSSNSSRTTATMVAQVLSRLRPPVVAE
jgi:hypothetical protein